MSLALAAQHLASKGRHGDSTLVHMTPREVAGLQALAHAHGHTLTINPETGLPEAFSLKSLLPMLGGAALTAVSGGALSPLMVAGIMGGGTALATGSLQKGLMAGLGAYGGAGIAGGLAGAGLAASPAAQAGNAAAAELANTNASLAETLGEGTSPSDILRARGAMPAGEAMQALPANPVQMSMTDRMLAGVKGLGTEAGRDAFMENIGGGKELLKYGAMAATPMLMSQSGQAGRPPSSGPNPYEYDFNPGYTGPVAAPGGGTRYFDPRYTRRMADGGSTGNFNTSDDYYRYLMGLAPLPRVYTPTVATSAAPAAASPAQVSLTPYQQSIARLTPAQLAAHNEYVQASRLDNQGPGAPTPAEVNEQAMANALSGVNGSLNPVAQTMSNLAQDLGLTNNALSIGLAVLGAAGGNPLALAPIAAANAAAIDPTNPSSINAQNAMDVGAHPALGFGGANNINAQIGSMGAHANPANNSGLTSGQINAINASIANTANIDPTGMGGVDPGIAAAMAADANIGIDPSGMGGIDPGVAAAAAAAAAASDPSGPDGSGIPGDGYAHGGLSSLAAFAQGGYNLGDYSDGGRLLKGPGDGVSDSIPASIADKRPARLADGEFVVPARIVSELGNGSTDAGARQLYAMMDRIQNARKKSVGKGKVAVNSRANKLLPA